MKSIDIKPPEKVNELYTVHLGNSTFYKFTSERACKAFIAKTNKFCTHCLFECNLLYTEVYTVYRQNWLYMDWAEHHSRHHKGGEDRKIAELLHSTSEVLDRTLFVDSHKHGSLLVFINFKKITRFLSEAVHVIKKLIVLRGATIENYACVNFLKRLMNLDNEVDNYGKLECCDIIDIDTSKIPNLFVLPKSKRA